jgi:nitrogen fixation/metabolism regulation signal transduction histidine kinase
MELHAVRGLLSARRLRWLLIVGAAFGAILLFLLATASANTELFAARYDVLLVVNGAIVVLLMLLVAYQLLRLRRNLRRGVFGSRLAVRLVLLFALVAVVPGALVYAVSVQFLGKSIESWFDVRVDRALEGGLNLGRRTLDYLLQETTNRASQVATILSEPASAPIAARLSRAIEQTGLSDATLYSTSGAVLAVAGAGAMRRARLQQPTAAIEQASEGTLMLRVVVPVNTDDRLEPLKVLQVVEPVPKPLAQDAEKVQAGWRDYQEISFSRQALKRLYWVTLTLTLLLALTFALGLAVVLSERFARPLGLLAEGTRAVAQGDFTLRQPVTSHDELGVLTESFNTMTVQLSDAHRKAEESRRAIETTSAYLESILGNLSAGVLAFDERYRLQTANASAAVILQQPLAELAGSPLADWARRLPALSSFAELVGEGFRASRDGQWQKQAELAVANMTRVLLLRGSRLPGTPVAGYVVVFDDVTDLAQAQRDAAWGEVARRLAHEIKNPLTPIQLSAERLELKLAGKLDGPDEDALRRGTQTIIAQVAAMKHMVDDFAVYARQPRPGRMQPVDLGGLLLDVLALYDNLRSHIALALPPTPLVVHGEPTRLRQVFHNLLQNSIDAQADSDNPRFEIALDSRGGGEDAEAVLTFADAGPGFAADVVQRAFEPYVTTKSKGTGLGLAIVKKIVDEHGGRIEIGSLAPHGARVSLFFPLPKRADR